MDQKTKIHGDWSSIGVYGTSITTSTCAVPGPQLVDEITTKRPF